MNEIPVFQIGAARLVTDLLKIGTTNYRRALEETKFYKIRRKKKKSGGYRTFHISPPELKRLQKRLLKNFFYRIYKRNLLDPRIHSFLPGHSIFSNAKAHTHKNWRYTLRFDLKDAFPSVNSLMVRGALNKIIDQEINLFTPIIFPEDTPGRYHRVFKEKSINLDPPLFPIKRVRWFRGIINKNEFRARDIAARFVDLIVDLTTYQNFLPQGAPTSPFLLNLVISQANILEKIHFLLEQSGYTNEITVYADDFVISSFRKIKPEMMEKITAIIEEANLKINSQKTIHFNHRTIAPLITGLKIATIKISGNKLDRLRGTNNQLISGVKKRIRNKGSWELKKVVVSKNYIKQTRGMINRAIYHPDDQKLIQKLEGRINYLKSVYPHPVDSYGLPNQILTPYLKYLELTEPPPIGN